MQSRSTLLYTHDAKIKQLNKLITNRVSQICFECFKNISKLPEVLLFAVTF